MNNEAMIKLLEQIEQHITDNNSNPDDVKDHMYKIKFLKSMVHAGEIETLVQLVSYIFYIAPENLSGKGLQ